jgi:26S proteasome regulatory subunit N7
MAPFYELVCKDLGWPVDQSLLAKMKSNNAEKLGQLDTTIEDAEQNLGEMEVRESNLRKAEFLCRIGDKVLFLTCIHCILKIIDRFLILFSRTQLLLHSERLTKRLSHWATVSTLFSTTSELAFST